MNNKVNYTLVGFFVIIGVVMILGFIFWLLQPSDDAKVKEYRIYFNESVLGLNMEAPVKYRGISVGKVTLLRINPKNSQQVEVGITIDKYTPIRTSTRAKLTSQGITGLSYINLTMGDVDAPFLKPKGDDEYPVIKTTPSFFQKIEDSFGDVSTNLSKTLSGTQKLLNEENQKEISKLLKRSASLMDKMDRLLDEKSILHFQSAMKNLDESSQKLNKLLPRVEVFVNNSIAWEQDIAVAFKKIMKSYITMQDMMEAFKKSLNDGEFNIKAIAEDVVPSIDQTLNQTQMLIIKLEQFLDKYESSPSDILYKQEEVKKGPGE